MAARGGGRNLQFKTAEVASRISARRADVRSFLLSAGLADSRSQVGPRTPVDLLRFEYAMFPTG